MSSGSSSARAAREHALLGADEEHDRELQALRRVQRQQDDLVLDAAPSGRSSVSATSDTCSRNSSTRVNSMRRADQLVEVLQPAVRLDGVLGLELVAVAGALERCLQQLGRPDRVVGEALGERVEQRDERGDAA